MMPVDRQSDLLNLPNGGTLQWYFIFILLMFAVTTNTTH